MYIAVMWHRIEDHFCRFEDRNLPCQKVLPFDTAKKKIKNLLSLKPPVSIGRLACF
jgi:hypothetical protein